MDGWMDGAPTPHLQKRELDSASQQRPVPATWIQGPKLEAGAPLEGRGPKGRVGGPAGRAFPARPAVPAGPALPPGLRALAAAMGHTHPRGPRSRSPGQTVVPTLRQATSPPWLPPQPAVQTVPGGRGAARVGRGRCARGQKGDFPAAPEKGAECPPREGRGEQPRRRACGRGWGRGGLPVSLAAARAATHPAPPDERYHWQQEEDGGRCRRRRRGGGGGGGGGPVGAVERGYAQDVGVAATASFPHGVGRLLLTTPSWFLRRPPCPRCSRHRPEPEGRSPRGDRAAVRDPTAIGVRRRRRGKSGACVT